MKIEIDKQMILESGRFGDSTSNMHYIPEYLNKGFHKIIDPVSNRIEAIKKQARDFKQDHSHDGEFQDEDGKVYNVHDKDNY